MHHLSDVTQIHLKPSRISSIRTLKCIILPLVLFTFLSICNTSILSGAIPYLIENMYEVIIHNSSSGSDHFYQCIAVIVEFRRVDLLVTVVHNINHHIPSTWPIQIFHGKDNENFIKNSTLAPLIKSEKVFLNLIGRTYTSEQYNILLTNPKFWQQVRGEKVLIFQIDSVMCSTSPHKVTDFLQYDYVGAPWSPIMKFDDRYRVGNGGFSLRSRSKTLSLLALHRLNFGRHEDVWYARNLHRVNGSIPSIEIAKTFSVESVYYPRPVGVHRYPWTCRFRTSLAKTCPESKLIMSRQCS